MLIYKCQYAKPKCWVRQSQEKQQIQMILFCRFTTPHHIVHTSLFDLSSCHRVQLLLTKTLITTMTLHCSRLLMPHLYHFYFLFSMTWSYDMSKLKVSSSSVLLQRTLVTLLVTSSFYSKAKLYYVVTWRFCNNGLNVKKRTPTSSEVTANGVSRVCSWNFQHSSNFFAAERNMQRRPDKYPHTAHRWQW